MGRGGMDGVTARSCSRVGCGDAAVATLTYVYADRMAVLGPLATVPEPHSYDLCGPHATRTAPPRGWLLTRVGMRELQA